MRSLAWARWDGEARRCGGGPSGGHRLGSLAVRVRGLPAAPMSAHSEQPLLLSVFSSVTFHHPLSSPFLVPSPLATLEAALFIPLVFALHLPPNGDGVRGGDSHPPLGRVGQGCTTG